MNSILNWNMTPPGLWRFRIEGIKDPEVAMVKGYYGYNDLEAEVIRRLKANHLPIPTDLRQRIVDQLCATLPDGWCSDGSMLSRLGSSVSHEFARVLQGTSTLIDWFVSDNRAKVSLEEANRRASICVGCDFNAPVAGCASCQKASLNTLVNKIVGGQPTSYDASLHSCAVCGCELRAKLWIGLETLQRNMSKAQLAQLPPAHNGFQGCWLRPEEPATLPA